MPVRMNMSAAVAAFALLLASPAGAQDFATDNELFAAYCAGAFRQTGEYFGTLFRDKICKPAWTGTCAEQLNNWAEVAREADEQQRRVLAYLTARGILSTKRSVEARTGALAAMEHGKSDTAACLTNGDRAPSQCIQSQRCRDLSRLAF